MSRRAAAAAAPVNGSPAQLSPYLFVCFVDSFLHCLFRRSCWDLQQTQKLQQQCRQSRDQARFERAFDGRSGGHRGGSMSDASSPPSARKPSISYASQASDWLCWLLWREQDVF